MLLSVQEMTLLCVMHSGTRAETLAMLRKAENEPPDKKAVTDSLIEKLSGMKPGETAELAFDREA